MRKFKKAYITIEVVITFAIVICFGALAMTKLRSHTNSVVAEGESIIDNGISKHQAELNSRP